LGDVVLQCFVKQKIVTQEPHVPMFYIYNTQPTNYSSTKNPVT